MWAVDASELIKRLTDIIDAKDPTDPLDRAIMVGIDRAISEICIMPSVRRD